MPPIVNKPLCSQPANTIQFNYTAPLIQANVTTPNNPNTFTGCTSTTYNACIKSTLLGGIGRPIHCTANI
ncbi:MAG: hypothetical protein JNK66_09875 [Chitinophagales bacterium]|nr:hypothetical protein [Chitinophagales bacterium]